jgi:hypothetical protein
MITFVAVAHDETLEPYIFITSLLLQTNPNWKCIVFCDGSNKNIEYIIKNFNDPRISYYESEKVKGCWGNANRKHALDCIVDTEFVIQASIQDYYVPVFVEEINKYTNNYDFIYYNCVHNHIDYEILNSKIEVAKIDWGSFVVKTSIAKEVGIEDFCNPLTDGMFVKRCFEKNLNIKHFKIKKCLFIHN